MAQDRTEQIFEIVARQIETNVTKCSGDSQAGPLRFVPAGRVGAADQDGFDHPRQLQPSHHLQGPDLSRPSAVHRLRQDARVSRMPAPYRAWTHQGTEGY